MTTTKPTADTTAAPDVVTQWLTEVEYLLDELDGGTLRKFDALIHAMPKGAAMFGVYTKLRERMGIPPDSLDPVGEALNSFGPRVANRANSISSSFALLTRRLLERIGELLDAGKQDPADPIILRRMFTEVAIDQHGRLVGIARRRTPDCPLDDLKPVAMGAVGEVFILGHPKAASWRKSLVRRLTDAANETIEYQRRERERIAEHERAMFEKANANNPARLAARVAELERQLATQRGDKPAI